MKTKPRTLATTVRCDARDAAMALSLLEDSGIRVQSISELFRETMSLVASLAIDKMLIPEMTDTGQAIVYLSERGIIDCLEKKRPNLSSLVKILSKEDKQAIIREGIERKVSDNLQESGIASLRANPDNVVEDEEI